MSLEVELKLIFAFVLLFLSGFFSSAETVFFSLIGRGGLGEFESAHPKLKNKLEHLLNQPKRLISSILIGNEIVNIIISILIASVFAYLYIDLAPVEAKKDPLALSLISMLVSTSLILVFGEVIPKTIGVRFARRLAYFMTAPLYWFHRIIFPIRYFLRRISELVLYILGIRISEGIKGLEEEDLLKLVEISEEQGIIDETEYELIKNIFEFGDLRVAEVMTPRQEIFSLPIDLDYQELKRRFLESGYSRVPIYEKEPDQVVGILSAKDLIQLEAQKGEKSIRDFLHPPYCVPPQKKLEDLLRDFLTQRIHFALVVNEYGEVIGMVTLEDLLEEIFGESAEEDEQEIREVSEGKWEVLGRMELRDFNEKMKTKLQAPGIKTLAGYLLNEFGRVPKVGEEIVREGYCFRVKEIRGRRIHKVEVEKKK